MVLCSPHLVWKGGNHPCVPRVMPRPHSCNGAKVTKSKINSCFLHLSIYRGGPSTSSHCCSSSCPCYLTYPVAWGNERENASSCVFFSFLSPSGHNVCAQKLFLEHPVLNQSGNSKFTCSGKRSISSPALHGAPNSCSSYISQVDKSLLLLYAAFKSLSCAQEPNPSPLSQGEILQRWTAQAGLEWIEVFLQFSAGLTELSNPEEEWGEEAARGCWCAAYHEPSRERQGFTTTTPGPRNYQGPLQLWGTWQAAYLREEHKSTFLGR